MVDRWRYDSANRNGIIKKSPSGTRATETWSSSHTPSSHKTHLQPTHTPSIMLTLLSLVPNASATALVVPATKDVPRIDITYSTLHGWVRQLQGILRNKLGVQRGQVVAMSIVNSVEFVVGFIGTGAARAVSAPLNPTYSIKEVEFYLRDTKPVLLLLPKLSMLSGAEKQGAENACKAAKHCNVRAAELWINEKGNVVVDVILPGIHTPTDDCLSDSVEDPEPDDVALVLHTSGTTGRPKSLEKTFKAPVLEAYAMTEAAHQMTSNDFLSRIPGTVGKGQGVQITIRDEHGCELPHGRKGEVCIRGENVTRGYWANEKANKESFWEGRWFRTGDQGFIHEDFPHHLELTGRLKELINRGGEKISPLEVDSAILAVHGVKEAVCFGVEDEKYGEIVWAAVVLTAGESEHGAEARIRKALDGKISSFKIPQRIIVLEQIPKGPTGKISRKNVREVLVKKYYKLKAKL
ncbi:hypothetical protein FRB99_005505 [Tulasnella sp. 403]|nr:hypothetical protein FRB99_005505 [Tulasnella sp. 403]